VTLVLGCVVLAGFLFLDWRAAAATKEVHLQFPESGNEGSANAALQRHHVGLVVWLP